MAKVFEVILRHLPARLLLVDLGEPGHPTLRRSVLPCFRVSQEVGDAHVLILLGADVHHNVARQVKQGHLEIMKVKERQD